MKLNNMFMLSTIKTSNGVFRENRCPHTTKFWFSTAVTLKIRSRSPKSNQLFVISQLYIHKNLVRIHQLVNNILCRQESVNANRNGICTKKQYILLPLGGGK